MSTACATFLISTSGPWFAILGIVFTDSVNIHRLADHIWVGNQTNFTTKVARIFMDKSGKLSCPIPRTCSSPSICWLLHAISPKLLLTYLYSGERIRWLSPNMLIFWKMAVTAPLFAEFAHWQLRISSSNSLTAKGKGHTVYLQIIV